MKKSNGFTLIELMVVVAIIGIIAAIAFPSYSDYMMKSRRNDGRAMVLDVAQKLERYFTERSTYTTDLTKLGFATSPMKSEHGYYSVSIVADGSYSACSSIASCFIIKATAQGAQSGDTKCKDLILTSANLKTATGTDPTKCW